MTKKTTNLIVVIAVVAVLIISVIVAVAVMNKTKEFTYEQDGLTFTRLGDKVTLTKYDSSQKKTEVTIPDSIDGFAVSAIGNEVFKGNETIESIVMSTNVKEIGQGAFMNCTRLSTVEAKGLVTIGADAFSGATNLSNIYMPTTLETIGERAFKNTSSLRQFKYTSNDQYVIDSVLSSVGKEAFDGSSVDKFVIPATLKNIGERAFAGARFGQVYFFEGVENIGKEAFALKYSRQCEIFTYNKDKTTNGTTDDTFNGLYNHSNAKFPASLKSIGERAFYNEDANQYNYLSMSDAYFGANLESIGDYAFTGANFNEIKFENANTKLGKYAFSQLRGYGVKVTLPENIAIIPEGLFFKTNISTYDAIKIPASVTDIEPGAFTALNSNSGRYSLEFVKDSPADKKYKVEVSNSFSGLLSKDGKILYSVLCAYNPIYQGNFVLPSTVNVIEKYAFANFGKDEVGTALTIPTTVSEVKAGAFSGIKLDRLYLQHRDNNVISIDKTAFDSDVTMLVSVVKDTNLLTKLKETFKGTNIEVLSYIPKNN